MDEQVLKDMIIKQEIKFYDINNIFFDGALNENQFEELKTIFSSYNNLSQIYFRENFDIESIEKVKYLLELSPTMNDSKIEKYILDTKCIDLDKLLDIDFPNENTWFISVEDENKRNKIYTIENYRVLNSLLNNIINKLELDNYSQIEKIGIIYDYCKKLKIDNKKNNNLIDSIKTKTFNKNELILLFQLLLRKLSIDSFIGDTINDGDKSKALIVSVNDDKYNIDGIYLFDVLSDYLYKEDVNDDNLRVINYNYFGIRISEYSKTVFNDKLVGLINYLSHDLEYDLEKINYISKEEIKYLELSLNNKFKDIHKKIEDTKEISDDDRLKIIERINSVDYTELIKENYLSRKDKILNYGILNKQ